MPGPLGKGGIGIPRPPGGGIMPCGRPPGRGIPGIGGIPGIPNGGGGTPSEILARSRYKDGRGKRAPGKCKWWRWVDARVLSEHRI